MYTEFHIKANALDEKFLKAVKAMFKSKSISIVVTEEQDETEYLLQNEANRKMLEDGLQQDEGYEFSLEEFSTLSKNLSKNKKTDTSKLKKIKISK